MTLPPITRAQARAIDERAQRELSLPGDILMENAGIRAAGHVARLARERGIGRLVVVCGTGNNGGDGLVIARQLLDDLSVRTILVGEKRRVAGDAAKNLARLEALHATVEEMTEPDRVAAAMANAPCVVVDALFGTGLDRPIEGFRADVVRAINEAGAPVVAVDVPSGLDADRGDILGAAVRATITVTFVAPKVGFAIGAGPELCGDVRVESIGFPVSRLAIED